MGIVTLVDSFNSLVQALDDALTSLCRDSLDLVDLSVSHLNNTVCKCFKTDVVRHHDHGNLLAHVQVNQDLHHNISASCVQVTRWLVEEEDLGLVGNRAGNRHTLLFATRELVGEMVHTLLETHVLQQLSGPLADLFTRELSLELHGKLNVFEGSKGADQVECLEDEAELVQSN